MLFRLVWVFMELLPLYLPLQCSPSLRLPLRPGPPALQTLEDFVRLHLGLRGRLGIGTRRAMEVALMELLGEELLALVLLLLALTSLDDHVTTREAAQASTAGEGRHFTVPASVEIFSFLPILQSHHLSYVIIVLE